MKMVSADSEVPESQRTVELFSRHTKDLEVSGNILWGGRGEEESRGQGLEGGRGER